ncbi:hypothetical protein Bca52824_061250 [Brassica carinata]|uniref:HotDog ACOT-type domain-containing protein n=1 Tax=Brassica carinata TaxID=52824 RepID=A0A8X7R1H1_BRACI|nr:hypothetical protein Bca52824_061250 [Brassica carinata]
MKSSSPKCIPVVSTFASPFDVTPPSSDSTRKPLSLWPGMYHSPVTIALWEARSKIFESLLDPPKDAPPQSELLTRTPSHSRTTIFYPFSTDYILREQYRDPWNEVRIGILLEDLDALAGTISVKVYMLRSDRNFFFIGFVDYLFWCEFSLVTASVDKIVLKKPISVDTDLKIVASVIWVGRSSIEIQLEVIQSELEDVDASPESVALTANFIFVARDSKTGKAAPINRLSPETELEKLLFEEAEARNNLRKKKRGGERKELEHGEYNKLGGLLAEGRIFSDMPALADRNSILLKDTRLENSLICQPQAFELAFSTAYTFAGLVPYFLEVDHVDFLRPVDVGDFLRFKSCVLYTQLDKVDCPLINIEVVAHVTSPEIRSSEVSNTFYFKFTVRPEAKARNNGFKLRNVVPATEEEARHILDRMDA